MYGNQVATCGPADVIRPQTLTERLEGEKQHIEARLEEINKILDGLNQNPDVADILDSVAKLGHLY